MNRALLLTMLCIALLTAPNARADGGYNRGIVATRAGDPVAAQAAFQEALAAGDLDPAVYHGLGNALYRQGQTGPALAAWRRGQRLSPRDGDLAANIDRVRASTTDRVDAPQAGSGPFFWLSFLSLAESTLLAGILGLIGGGGLVARELAHRRNPTTRRWGTDTIVGLGGALLLGASTLAATRGATSAVVIVSEVAAASALGPDGIELFVLHEGAEVAIVEQTDRDLLVALPDARKGWLPQSAVISTNPAAPFPPE